MRYTKHASVRIQERGITLNEVQDLIDNGKYLVNRHNADRWTLVHTDRTKKLSMVLTQDKSTVITIMYQGSNR